MSRSPKGILKSLNEVVVTPDDLTDVIEELNLRHEKGEYEQGDSLIITAIKFSGQPNKGMAVHTRMTALAKIIDGDSAPGWTKPPNQDGAVWTKGELIEVAASYPLSEIDGDFGFEVNGFLAEALRLIEVEGSS